MKQFPLSLEAANDPGDPPPAYAELHCLSDFSFLRGASDAMALFERARDCGYSALAITDECSLAGIVRALEASEATGVPLVVGSEFVLADGLKCVLLVQTQAGYTRLCELVTVARRGVDGKGYQLARADVEQVVGRPRDRRPQDEPGAGAVVEPGGLVVPGFGDQATVKADGRGLDDPEEGRKPGAEVCGRQDFPGDGHRRHRRPEDGLPTGGDGV